MEIDQCNLSSKGVLFYFIFVLADWTRMPTECGGFGSGSTAMLLPGYDILNIYTIQVIFLLINWY